MKIYHFHSSLRRGAAVSLLLAVLFILLIGTAAAEAVHTAESIAATGTTFTARQAFPQAPGFYNPLFGKTLVAVGDSLTAGYELTPDPQTGIMQTYPVLVGNRNHMQVINAAFSGAWMTSGRYRGADVEGFSSYFDDDGFLPDAIDYLTLNFGANDWSNGVIGLMDDYCIAHFGTLYNQSTAMQKAEAETAEDWNSLFIGSESDTGISTWWGAWNTVLTYLRTYYPRTKVGILVSYPCPYGESDFAAQMRAELFTIAKKYGYPTMDCGDADQWFCIGYAQGLDPAIADLIAEEYTIDGCHPNELGHQMMADSYEAWLKRI